MSVEVPLELEPFVFPGGRLGVPGDEHIPFVLEVSAERMPTASQIASAVMCGAGIRIWDLFNAPAGGGSIRILGEVIGDVRYLAVGGTGPFTDLDVLAEATSLQSLRWDAPTEEIASVDHLPLLRSFVGLGSRQFWTAWINPGLQELILRDPETLNAPTVVAELSMLSVNGGATEWLPTLANPNTLTDVRRGFVQGFGLDLLEPFISVRSLTLTRCSDLKGLAALRQLRELDSLTVDECSTSERLEDLLDLTLSAATIFTSPPPSNEFGVAARSRGWATNARAGNGLEPFEIQEEDPNTILLTSFLELDAAVRGSRVEPNGLLAERIAALVARSLHPNMRAEFDAESGSMSVKTTSARQARQLAQTLHKVWSDPATLVDLVQATLRA